jgi:ribonuclease P protein component
VHVLSAFELEVAAAPEPVIRVGGPRFGLIVSKAVGTAVVRHRVARRLRHICADLIHELPVEVDIVIRALPGAVDASTAELDRQLRAALRKLEPQAQTAWPVTSSQGSAVRLS